MLYPTELPGQVVLFQQVMFSRFLSIDHYLQPFIQPVY
jgi:hypothetical protein